MNRCRICGHGVSAHRRAGCRTCVMQGAPDPCPFAITMPQLRRDPALMLVMLPILSARALAQLQEV